MAFEHIDFALVWTSREAKNATDMIWPSDHGDDWRPVIAAKITSLFMRISLSFTKKKKRVKKKKIKRVYRLIQ